MAEPLAGRRRSPLLKTKKPSGLRRWRVLSTLRPPRPRRVMCLKEAVGYSGFRFDLLSTPSRTDVQWFDRGFRQRLQMRGSDGLTPSSPNYSCSRLFMYVLTLRESARGCQVFFHGCLCPFGHPQRELLSGSRHSNALVSRRSESARGNLHRPTGANLE